MLIPTSPTQSGRKKKVKYIDAYIKNKNIYLILLYNTQTISSYYQVNAMPHFTNVL